MAVDFGLNVPANDGSQEVAFRLQCQHQEFRHSKSNLMLSNDSLTWFSIILHELVDELPSVFSDLTNVRKR